MSYGDQNNPVHGRAQVPGSGGDSVEPNGEQPPPAPAGGRPPTSGRPVAGRATVGRASVSGAPTGRAPVSGAPTGRAAVSGAPTGRASVSGGPTGRASVPVPPIDGPAGRIPVDRAAAGRASVRGSAAVGGIVRVDDADLDPSGRRFSEPALLGGPVAGSRGPRNSRAKRRRRRNIIVSAIAVFIMLTGGGLVGGTYFFDTVDVPADATLAESTMIYYADGITPMAKIGDQSRTVLGDDQIPDVVAHAVVATEDNSFYTNSGIDFRGIARAAWNNVTGGQRQGASTISQQYARSVATLKDISYARKLREAVIARKLNETYTKKQLMAKYLNMVFFGRHAYGIEAAAQAYFGKPTKDLTMAEAMVLAGIIKEPSPGGKASPYDPTVHPETAIPRFTNYIKPNMVKLGYLSAAEAAAMQYPTTVLKYDPKADTLSRESFGMTKPTGLVVHHAMDEMSKIMGVDGKPMFTDIKNAGLKIVTTIDPKMQQAAEIAASGATKASPLFQQPDKLQGTLVAVAPGTGQVKAYYGGPDGSKIDYAGIYSDPVMASGTLTNNGQHPPGSSMKIYTLLAALREGYSIDSVWDGSDTKEFKSAIKPISNSTRANCQIDKQHCTLWESTEQSLNTTFYGVADTIGAAKVLDIARQAGVGSMWETVNVAGNNVAVRRDLNAVPVDKLSFDPHVGIGQFPITVLDQATGVSALATRGKAAKAHFVQSVWKQGKLRYAEHIAAQPIQGLKPEMVDSAAWALQKVVKHYNVELAGGRQAAGKTGTWERGTADPNNNAHAWFAGYTLQDLGKKSPGLAAAVWVGNKNDELPIRDAKGNSIIGGKMAAPIWKVFMDLATKDMPKVNFPEPKPVGDKMVGNTTPPPPVAGDPNNPGGNPFDPRDPACALVPQFCATPTNNNGNNGNNGNGRGGG
jgi:membrane peptidoglycan carboxypeptidase